MHNTNFALQFRRNVTLRLYSRTTHVGEPDSTHPVQCPLLNSDSIIHSAALIANATCLNFVLCSKIHR